MRRGCGSGWRSAAGASRRGREEAQLERRAHVLGALDEAHLVVDAAPVRVGGLGADVEALADLRRRVALRHEQEDLALAVAQRGVARPYVLPLRALGPPLGEY